MPAEKLSRKQFHGVWIFEEWRIEYEDGSITHPMGKNARGQIIYLEDGIVTVTILNAERAFNYVANWSLKDDNVLHEITSSLNGKAGTSSVRKVEFDGENSLTLSTYEIKKNGQKRQHFLQWEKMK